MIGEPLLERWSSRPPEVAFNLNPAFCGYLLYEFVNSYRKRVNRPVPLALSFLVLPIVLHAPTRLCLPPTARSRLHSWVEAHPEVRIGFAKRARALVPFTREGLIFAFRYGALSIRSTGIVHSRITTSHYRPPKHLDPSKCKGASSRLGSILAVAGNVETVFALMGVRL